MRKINKSGFTLVELLVVITILAIISVVAYQNFGGAVNKAVGGKKLSDVSTIEAALQQYKFDNNYYPSTSVYDSSKNLWGYTGTVVATPSNKIDIDLSGEEILSVQLTSTGGGKIYGSGTLGQIGAKGVIDGDTLGKKYLSKELYDPELGDTKVGTGKMIDYGIGKYVYATYRNSTTWTSSNEKGSSYNLAFTVKDIENDIYVSKIVGDYDETACSTNSSLCPGTLIGTMSGSTTKTFIIDGQKEGQTNTGATIPSYTSSDALQGVPYPIAELD